MLRPNVLDPQLRRLYRDNDYQMNGIFGSTRNVQSSRAGQKQCERCQMQRQHDQKDGGSQGFCRHALEFPDFAQGIRVRLDVDCQILGQVPARLNLNVWIAIGFRDSAEGRAAGRLDISKHLQVLERAGLIVRRVEGAGCMEQGMETSYARLERVI